MYAAESNAPEGRGTQAPDLWGGCVYGHGRGDAGRPRLWAGAKRRGRGARQNAWPMPPSRPNRPPSFRSAALELSASCVRAGFPPSGRPGRV